MAPAITSPQRGHYYQYLTWMSNTLQDAANRRAHPEHYVTNNDSASDDNGSNSDTNLTQVMDKATQDLNRCWSIIDVELGNKGPWLLGDNISGADFHLFMVAYWIRRYDRCSKRIGEINT